jgi:hypothetical protein
MAAWADHSLPPDDDADTLGFHHLVYDVELAVFGVEHWHVLPYAGGLFDQPETLINDMLRYIASRSRARDENEGRIYAPSDAYDDLDATIERFSL